MNSNKYMFLFQTEPGKLLSDELGKASEARPFPRKKEGGKAYEKKIRFTKRK